MAVSAIAMLVALLPMPYGYYTAMKGWLFFLSIAGGVNFARIVGFRSRESWWLVGGAIACLLYNPIYPFTMRKADWAMYNLLLLLPLAVLTLRRPSSPFAAANPETPKV